jgi:hypothetical protein
MENNAERAVIGVSVDGVNVSHLDEGEHCEQCQAQHDDGGAGFEPCASVTARPCVKSIQT